jgi:quercetin dioxygenase-like cupin family protein
MGQVYVANGEGRTDRVWIKSGDDDYYSVKSVVHHGNTGIQSFRIGMVELEAGKAVGAHKHNCEEAFYVLEGRGVFTVDGVQYPAGPGDSVFVAPNVVHGEHRNSGTALWRFLAICGQALEPLTPDHVFLPSGERPLSPA